MLINSKVNSVRKKSCNFESVSVLFLSLLSLPCSLSSFHFSRILLLSSSSLFSAWVRTSEHSLSFGLNGFTLLIVLKTLPTSRSVVRRDSKRSLSERVRV